MYAFGHYTQKYDMCQILCAKYTIPNTSLHNNQIYALDNIVI